MSKSKGPASDKGAEAAKLYKEATKLLGPSIIDFRLKPDWEAASPLLDRAALLFRQAGDVDRALEAYEKAATAQEKIGSAWHAAKHLESATDICRQHKRWEGVKEYTKSAAELYINAGKATIGADCLARGARILESEDTEAALALLYDALDIYESDDRESNGQDVFRQAISVAVKAQLWQDAVEFQMRFASYCERTRAKTSQCRCYLGAIVTHLYAKEAKQAWRLFQDALAVDCFVSSEEAFAADALFEAYRSGSEAAVQQAVASKSIFKQLDNQVARLAVKLPQGRMEKMARRVARAMGGEGGGGQRSEGEQGAEEDAGGEAGDGDGDGDDALL